MLPILLQVPYTIENEEWACEFIEKVKAGKIGIAFTEEPCK